MLIFKYTLCKYINRIHIIIVVHDYFGDLAPKTRNYALVFNIR